MTGLHRWLLSQIKASSLHYILDSLWSHKLIWSSVLESGTTGNLHSGFYPTQHPDRSGLGDLNWSFYILESYGAYRKRLFKDFISQLTVFCLFVCFRPSHGMCLILSLLGSPWLFYCLLGYRYCDGINILSDAAVSSRKHFTIFCQLDLIFR